jgi:hypothetical protein
MKQSAGFCVVAEDKSLGIHLKQILDGPGFRFTLSHQSKADTM